MSDPVVDPIHGSLGWVDSIRDTQKPKNPTQVEISGNNDVSRSKNGKNSSNSVIVKRERPTRACTSRAPKYVDPPVIERRSKGPRKEKEKEKVVVGEDEVFSCEEENEVIGQCSSSISTTKVVTSLVNPPLPEQIARWRLRSMWQLASLLHFLHVSFDFYEYFIDF